MSSSIIVSNSIRSEFDFLKIQINTQYNILLHCVYDPFNQFETEFDFLNDPKFDNTWIIILWHPVERGVFHPTWMAKLDTIVNSAPYKLVYLTGCSHKVNIHTQIPHTFNIKFFPIFDIRIIDIWKASPLSGPQPISVTKSKKFICLNAKDLSHRRYTFANLVKNNLIEEGIVSYQCIGGKQELNNEFTIGSGFTQEQLDAISKMCATVNDIIPLFLIDKNDILNRLPRELFLDSYLNVVCETQYMNIPFGFNTSFITEKTFNAIANNQLFIIVGHAGSLDLLHHLGYKTFDGIIDESYDTILNNGDRLDAVSKEIVRFISRPIDQIQDDYSKILDIIEHNRNLLFSQNLETRLQNFINENYA